MSFTSSKETIPKIRIVTSTGNTVGYINLTKGFIKAVIAKNIVPTADIEAIDGDFEEYIKTLHIVVEDSVPVTKIEAKDF